MRYLLRSIGRGLISLQLSTTPPASLYLKNGTINLFSPEQSSQDILGNHHTNNCNRDSHRIRQNALKMCYFKTRKHKRKQLYPMFGFFRSAGRQHDYVSSFVFEKTRTHKNTRLVIAKPWEQDKANTRVGSAGMRYFVKTSSAFAKKNSPLPIFVV